MKAVINGIEVEGTPDEIVEYRRLEEEEKHRKIVESFMSMPVYVPMFYLSDTE